MAYSTLYQHYYRGQQSLLIYLSIRGLSAEELSQLKWSDIDGSFVSKGKKRIKLTPEQNKIWRRCKLQAGKQPIDLPLVFYKKVPDEFSPGSLYSPLEIWELTGRPDLKTEVKQKFLLHIPRFRFH